jgi:UDP:flavonoid glycosyltransferase YjiC (YdhE family)
MGGAPPLRRGGLTEGATAMRVLFTTWAWPTHYQPMVPLAWALRAAGHEVRMTSQPELLATMRGSGLPCTAIGRDVDIAGVYLAASKRVGRVEPAARGVDGPVDRAQHSVRLTDRLAGTLDRADPPASFRMLRGLEDETALLFRAFPRPEGAAGRPRLLLWGEVADAVTDGLLALARSWRPDLIVYDPLTYAGPLVAKLLAIPAVRSLFGPDVTYFLTGARLGPLLERFGLGEDDVDVRGAATVDPCPPSVQFADAIVPTRRIRSRYVPYPGFAEVPAWLPDRPTRPRICLTWGTSIHRMLGADAFLPGDILAGAAKLADERDAELVLAITASQRTLLPPALPPTVRVLESVPLDALLPTCQALIHQGGAGTTLTALRHGLPQLVLPLIFDQGVNAYQLVAAGAGLTRAAAGLTAAQLLADGHELLDNPAYRAAAQRVQQEMRDLPPPADAVAELAALA